MWSAMGMSDRRLRRAIDTARQVDTVDDIAPLIRTTHLQNTAITTAKFHKVISLKDHVVEFEESSATAHDQGVISQIQSSACG